MVIDSTGRRVEWPRSALGWAAIAALVAIVLHVIGPVAQMLMLAFAGILGGVFLDGLARLLHERTRMRRGLALAIVLFGIVLVVAGGAALLAPRLVSEARALAESLPDAVANGRAALEHVPVFGNVAAALPGTDQLASRLGDVLAWGGRFVGGVTAVLGGIVLIAFVALVIALEPSAYGPPLLRLVPMERRQRWREVFGTVREKLFWWVIGRFINMAIIGTLTSVGLAIIGVPAPVALGVLAGLLTFVPNIGPVVSFVPAAVLAVVQGPGTLLATAGLYLGAQGLESYVVTPLVQRRAAAVPPALLVTAQVTLGVPLGALGLLLATPLAAIVIVLVRAFYVEDRLGDRAHGEEEGEGARRQDAARRVPAHA